MSRKGTHQKKKTLQEQDQSGKVVYTLQTNNKISLRWRAALHRLNFPYLRVTVSHSVHLFAPHLSQFLSLPFSLSWGLIAGLTDSVEEQCVANMRRKRGVCVSSAGHEWASVRAMLWREVKRVPLFSCERLTCKICVKLTSALASPLLSISV